MAMSLSTTLLASSRSPDKSACVAPAMASPTNAKIWTTLGRISSSAVATKGTTSSGSGRFPKSRFTTKGYFWVTAPTYGGSVTTKGIEMVAVISAVAGLAFGVAVTWAYSVKRSQSFREDVLRAESDVRVRDSQLEEASVRLERQRVDHEMAMTQMEQTFKVLSTDVLDETVLRFNQSQE